MAKFSDARDALRRALDAGNQPLAAELARRLKTEQFEEEMNPLASGALGASQGATFGFGDELYGLLRGAAAMVPGGTSPGEAYKAGTRDVRDALEVARREDPWITGGGEFLGGLATGGTGLARSAANVGLRAGLGRAAAAGAAMGAGAGYGYSEGDPIAAMLTGGDVGSEAARAAADTAQGAAAGGVLGTAFPLAGAGVRALARKVAKWTPKGRIAVLNEAGRREIADSLERDARIMSEVEGITPEAALARMQRTIDDTPGMVAGDIGNSMQNQVERIGQYNTSGAIKLEQMAEKRVTGQYDQIVPMMTKILNPNAPARADDYGRQFQRVYEGVLSNLKKTAEENYRNAEAVPMVLTRRMRQLLSNKATGGRSAMSAARDMARAEGRKVSFSPNLMNEPVHLKDLDAALRAWDDVVSARFASTKGKERALANTAKRYRDEFRELLYRDNADYRLARQAWSGGKAEQEALDNGLRIFRDPVYLTDKTVREMTEGQRAFYRVGVMRAFEDKLSSKSDVADAVKQISGTRKLRETLRLAFGDEAKANEFLDQMQQQSQMFETYAKAFGNSRTARRAIQATDAMDNLVALGSYGIGLGAIPGLPPSIAGHLGKKIYQGFRGNSLNRTMEDVMNNQANLLMTRNLQNIMKPHQMGGLLQAGLPAAATAATGAGIAGGFAQPGLLE